ncbi:MAG: urease accessory protein UreD [Bilifractor sp.]
MEKRYDGEIRLGFTNRNGRTVAQSTYRRGNSRISGNIPVAGEIPYYFLISTGGGFTEGEQYLQNVTMDDHCHVILTTQTPNYVYKCENGGLTTQNNLVHIGEDSFLEYYIDETIPYAHARFRQNTEIRMGRGSRLIFTDGLTAGWSDDETPFQYNDIGLKTRIWMEDHLLLNDFLLIDPSQCPMQEIGCFEEAQYYNSAVIIDEQAGPEMLEKMRAFLNKHFSASGTIRYGLSLLDQNGIILRILGQSIEENRSLLYALTEYYREEILGFAHFSLRKNNGWDFQ